MRVTLRVLLLALASITATGYAQNVVLVTGSGTATEGPDVAYLNYLENYRGYNVTPGLFDAIDTDAAQLATLNAADLVLFSRNTTSGTYANTPAEVAAWDGLTTPLLLGNAFLSGTNRWSWVDGTATQQNYDGDISAPVGTTEVHPFFEGLEADLGDLINFPPLSGIAKYDWTNSADINGSGIILGTGEVIGVRNNPTAPNIIIGSWDGGGATGSGNTLGSDRIFFALPEELGNFRNSGLPLFNNILDSMLGPLADGDVNLDGSIDIDDFNLIRDNFGEATNSRLLGDLNFDTVVDLEDYNLWVSAVDPVIAAQASLTAVPEPSSLALVGIGALGFIAARKRRGVLSLAMFSALLLSATHQARAVQIWGSAMDGNANDTIGGNNGTVAGTGVTTATPDRHGNPSGAVLFDGASYFQIPNTGTGGSLSNQISTEGSFSLWVRIDNVAGESGPIALGGSGGGTTQYFSLLNTTNGNDVNNNVHGWRVDLDRGAADAADNKSRQGALSDGTGVDGNGYAPMGTGGVWQHLAATFKVDGELRLYVNGELQSVTPDLTDTTPFATTNPWVIGAERIDERMMIGAIDDVKIYSSALEPEDIADLANLIAGDVNNDGVADINDFNLIRDNFGNQDVFLRREGDLNQDRVVNHLDFAEWKNSVSPSIAAMASWTTVPEPGSLAMLAMGALGVLVLHRKRGASRQLG